MYCKIENKNKKFKINNLKETDKNDVINEHMSSRVDKLMCSFLSNVAYWGSFFFFSTLLYGHKPVKNRVDAVTRIIFY